MITISSLNAQNGDVLAREEVEAESKEQVLKSLDHAATNLRKKLGESIGSVQKFATPLEQATTSSLDALQAFSLGQADHSRGDDAKAIPNLKRAVELDPNFAMANATLGVAYSNLTQVELSETFIAKAFDLRERASEREKLYVSSHYHDLVTRDLIKAIEVYEQWIQTYPRDTPPRDNLALRYTAIGQPDKALASSTEAMRIDPDDYYAYQNVSDAYERLGRLDEAKAVAEKIAAKQRSVHFTLFELAVLRGDESAEEHELQLAAGQPDEPIMKWFHARSDMARGKLQVGRKEYAESESAAVRMGYKEFSGVILGIEAADEIKLGNTAEARQKISEALAASQDRDTQQIAMVQLAELGDASRSQKIAEQLVRRYPSDTLLNKVWVPVSQAFTDLQHNQPAQAVTHLEGAAPYELGTGPGTAGYFINYLRAEAYLRSKDGAKAAAEYQKILSHHFTDPLDCTYNLSHLGLGRAYALQGNTAAAKSAYQDFFAAWKDADPDVPVLKQAKAEYEKL